MRYRPSDLLIAGLIAWASTAIVGWWLIVMMGVL